MRHRATHEHRAFIRFCQNGYELFHQLRYEPVVRALVHHDTVLVIVYEYLPSSVLAWALVQIVTEHHEVEAAQKRLVEREMGVIGQLLRVGQGIAIADDFQRGPVVSIERLLVFQEGYCIVEGDVVALNAVGAADGTRLEITAQ